RSSMKTMSMSLMSVKSVTEAVAAQGRRAGARMQVAMPKGRQSPAAAVMRSCADERLQHAAPQTRPAGQPRNARLHRNDPGTDAESAADAGGARCDCAGTDRQRQDRGVRAESAADPRRGHDP